MSISSASAASGTSAYGAAFWERLWRSAGIQSAGLFIIAYFVYGYQPQADAPIADLVAFYGGNRARILIASVVFGFAVLNLLWFAAAIRTTLADAGQDGWGAAATASSALLGAMLLLLVTIGAALAYSIAGTGNQLLTSGLHDVEWACFVLSSFPRAMLTMAIALGLWRAGLISNTLFAVGVAAVILVLAGGTTWQSGGVWAPDGVYSRFVSPLIGLAWIVIASRVVLSKPAARAGF
jgi:hypothetical protein